ncbi:uncharacterized protein LOC103875088 [Brassica rapa]|uniref:DUF1216 domain-containing protein n=4 Tax=Brassica TaxID=3705 RepID=A0A8D9DEC5_BRACM|nr:uncharacterized protein LOC103875088 [Brassica rapa]CAF2089891.1 unnamed protein product [Brassica napus]CAG7872529.1 unnamed protein product [Brassica rapa]
MARVQLLLLCFTFLFASVTFMEHVSSATTATTTSSTTVAELEAETSKEVMEFIMKLEKKCPPKEEYKSFFEKLKATMVASAKVTQEKKKGFFSTAAGKISDAVSFIGSKFTGKSPEVKKSMETYQQEVAKSLQELEAIHKKIIEANQGKVEGSVAVTAEQKTEIKQTITRWETVTTQFVETAIQTEAASNTTVGVDKVKLP